MKVPLVHALFLPPYDAAERAPHVLREPILLIHGTFANSCTGDGADWWHPRSAFCHDLDERLQNEGALARCWANLGSGDVPFAWTGANSEKDRRDAGKALAAKLEALEMDKGVGRYHLVGHSHGGNVIINALHTMVRKPLKLGAVIFLGTPALPFRHPEMFDDRWVWIPLYLIVFAGAAFELVQPGDYQVLWMPVIIVVILALLVELLLKPKPPGRRLDAELYGSGSPSAFRFDGDEAIGALLSAQKIAQDPNRFVEQFLQTKPPQEFAFAPTSKPLRQLRDWLERTSAYRVMRMLKLNQPTQPGAPAEFPTPQYTVGSKASAAETRDEILRNASDFVATVLNSVAIWKPIAKITLWVLALLPAVLSLIVTPVAQVLSWCGSVLRRLVVECLFAAAKRGVGLGLPILVSKVAFGEDDGSFLAIAELPPACWPGEPISKEMQDEVAAVANQVGTGTGHAVFAVVVEDDVFAIKTLVERALSDTALVHSHYYRSPHVKARIAQLIARPARPAKPWLPLLSANPNTPWREREAAIGRDRWWESLRFWIMLFVALIGALAAIVAVVEGWRMPW